MTKTLLTAAALVVAITTSAVAKTYTYACQVKDERDNVHLYAAKIDTKAGTLTWRGSVYRLGPVTVDCAKYCFQATRRDGATAILSLIATYCESDGIDVFRQFVADAFEPRT